jgi:predicted TIM-barrel fold metal-dependent hydrolase
MLGGLEQLRVDPSDPRQAAAPGAQFENIPGLLLNRLNPLKGLSESEREDVIAQFRELRESYGNRDLRLALMDDQSIEKALMFPASAHDIEFEFVDDIEAMYANARAFNRWIHEEIGYAYCDRMFLPPYLPLADVDLALRELELLLERGTPLIQIKSGHAHGGRGAPYGGRSPADPVFDPIWSRINEAGIRVTAHLGGTDYQKHGADWSENPDDTFGQFDAFQWVMYWGDRPAMELTAGLILHNFFGRFPNIRVCLAEQGTVWVPYTVRKMDHAFMLGRKAKWGDLTDRPSHIFRRHFLVAPYPEENVERVVAEVGVDPIVFGSDFPHGEGLAMPIEYVDAQLSSFSEGDKRRIMRDNLEEFLTAKV